MEKENSKKAAPDIDENLMMNLMVDGVQVNGLQLPPELEKEVSENKENKIENVQERNLPREKNKIKKASNADYESIFFKKTDTNARDGKTVYIRPDFHEKLTRIIQVIGGDKISIYTYLDNMLDYHFKEFGEQITKSYNDKYKPIL